MARKRRTRLGAPNEDHGSQFAQLAREAQNAFDGLPPTCSGGIHAVARLEHKIGAARAHFWAMATEQRAAHSAAMGKLNTMDKKLGAAINKMANNCGFPHDRDPKVRPGRWQ